MASVDTEPAFMTIEEVADLLRISPSHTKELFKRKALPGGHKVGKLWRINRAVLMASIGLGEDHKRPNGSDVPSSPAVTA